MTSLSNTCRWFPAEIQKHDNNSHVYINLEFLRVITEYLVSIFNNGCYRIIYYSFLNISRQISILNKNILTDKLTNLDEVLLKSFRITLCVITFRMLDTSCVRLVAKL